MANCYGEKKMKNKIAILLVLPILVLGGYMLYLNAMTKFNRVEVVVQGYDPKDFLSGYYLYLRPDWNETDCTQFADGVCPQKEFDETFTFYIRSEHSDKLTQQVNAGVVKLVFSYSPQHKPLIVDMLVDGKSYLEFVRQKK